MKPNRLLKPLSFSIAALLLAMPVLAEELEKKAPTLNVDPSPVAPKPGIVTTFAPIVEKVAPSVVTVSTSKMVTGAQRRQNPMFNDPMFRRFFGIPEPDENEGAVPAPKRKGLAKPEKPHKEPIGLGSGVIVSPEGHILTNNHVIEGADEIIVKLGKNSHEYKATKIGTDPDSDLAVLKIEGKDLPAITFADSEKVRVGDVVLAVGNPFGFTQSVTTGIVSALGRGMPELDLSFQNFIQTDASINPGNSGGALVDTDGRLIGVNTAIYSRSGGNQGIGFAVPGNLARDVMDGILKNGRVIRGYLGINLQEMDEELAKEFKLSGDKGALVAGFPKDGTSPAQKAGIREGDVIVGVDGKLVDGRQELIQMVSSKPPGTEVSVKLLRDGKETVVPVKLGERPGKNQIAKAEPGEAEPDVLDGVTVADIDGDTRKKYDVPESTKGVIVTQIDPESPSYAAGIREGDVIHEIKKEAVTTSKQAVELSEKVKKDKTVLLRVSTKGSSRFVVVAQKE